jgi:hypothetical protein
MAGIVTNPALPHGRLALLVQPGFDLLAAGRAAGHLVAGQLRLFLQLTEPAGGLQNDLQALHIRRLATDGLFVDRVLAARAAFAGHGHLRLEELPHRLAADEVQPLMLLPALQPPGRGRVGVEGWLWIAP